MISLLARFFCKSDGKSPAQLRTAYGILCGAVGIGLNLLLFLGKFFAGTLSGSVAITADAFNNLSDAGSSVVTLLGFRIAAKAPDPGHPFGHGRAEYLSGLAVSMLILLMGVELAKESLNKILHPALVEFSWLVIGILAASICVKLYMAMYNRSLGKKLSAPALLAAAADSLGDCMSTSAVLVATLIGHYFQLPVDGWVGILVALFIFKGGIVLVGHKNILVLGGVGSPHHGVHHARTQRWKGGENGVEYQKQAEQQQNNDSAALMPPHELSGIGRRFLGGGCRCSRRLGGLPCGLTGLLGVFPLDFPLLGHAGKKSAV